MKTIERNDMTTEAELNKAIKDLCKANPGKYITYHCMFGTVWMYVHERKPQSLNSGGAEYTYRHDGGFWKDGKIVKPSNTFIKKFNFCPVLG